MKLIFIIALLVSSVAFGQVDYDRSDWQHWEDFDGDCQNTRQELLISTSLAPVSFTNVRKCTVATGIWIGPYTGQVFTIASDVDIDHIIPLKYAHDHGGALWSPLLKKVFANDPDNLLVTEDNTSEAKDAYAIYVRKPTLSATQIAKLKAEFDAPKSLRAVLAAKHGVSIASSYKLAKSV